MLNTLAFMYSVHFCYQTIINKWNMLIIICKTHSVCHAALFILKYTNQYKDQNLRFGFSDISLLSKYLSHRRDGSRYLKFSTWSTILFTALRHSSNRMLESTHQSWNSAMFLCAIRLTGLPSGHQCLHIQSNMCTNYKYNQMQGDGFTVPQAYDTGPGISTYTRQHITR
jgi:hypothetical protein